MSRVNLRIPTVASTAKVPTVSGMKNIASVAKSVNIGRKKPFELKKLEGLIPFASNAANAFRSLPSPSAPLQATPFRSAHVNYDGARANAASELASFNRDTDYRVTNRSVAQGLKAKALAGSVANMNELNQQEQNTNANLDNQANFINQQVQEGNLGRIQNYNDAILGRSLKQQELTSENLADAGNKVQLMRNDNALMDLEHRKLNLLPKLYETGVYGRNLEKEHNTAESNLTYAFGGELGTDPKPAGKTNTTSGTVDTTGLPVSPPRFGGYPYRNPTVYSRQQFERGEIPLKEVNVLKAFRSDQDLGSVTSGTHVRPDGSEFFNQVVDSTSRHLPKSGQMTPTGNPAGYLKGDQIALRRLGGSIHIKPSHRGRFTEYLKRTGSTLTQALHSPSAHVRQMANFARNARTWKHEYGGEIISPGAEHNMTLAGGGMINIPMSLKKIKSLYV